MNRLSIVVVCLAALAVACEGQLSPTGTVAPSPVVASQPTVPVAPVSAPTLNLDPKSLDPAPAPAPGTLGPNQISKSGGWGNCATTPTVKPGSKDIITWAIDVGVRTTPLHLRALTFHTGKPGCAATTERARRNTLQITGKEDYKVGESGRTTYSYNLGQYPDGATQVDIDANPDVTSERQTLVGEVINYGVGSKTIQ
jgi:hypothetical protein